MKNKDRHIIANDVFNILKEDFQNYSSETIKNRALFELDENLTLSANEISEIIKPLLKLR